MDCAPEHPNTTQDGYSGTWAPEIPVDCEPPAPATTTTIGTVVPPTDSQLAFTGGDVVGLTALAVGVVVSGVTLKILGKRIRHER